ncbi:MAG: dihydrodipicolinate synthase family protein [Verrucomicrobia bacterium]|nr:dihydrodipicolinate synthase family protein [Verrucomicrobiota bacterium]
MVKPLGAAEIRGNWATLLLPILPDESIDFDLLETGLDHFARVGVDGIYSNGSAGEFYTQTEAEFDRINELLARKCEARQIPFQIGATHTSPQIALERIKRTRALQPSGFQVILPDWFPPTFDDICRFLDVMAKAASPIPLIIYNPPHAKRKVSPAEWEMIAARFPTVVGVKVPGGDESWYAAMKPLFSRLSVFIPGHTLATGLSRGAHGAYSNVACLSPGGAQYWYELCRSDPAAGLALEAKINRLFSEEVVSLVTELKLPNMAADKALAAAGGWLPGFHQRLRWPYAHASDADVARISAAARRLVPELFSVPLG